MVSFICVHSQLESNYLQPNIFSGYCVIVMCLHGPFFSSQVYFLCAAIYEWCLSLLLYYCWHYCLKIWQRHSSIFKNIFCNDCNQPFSCEIHIYIQRVPKYVYTFQEMMYCNVYIFSSTLCTVYYKVSYTIFD